MSAVIHTYTDKELTITKAGAQHKGLIHDFYQTEQEKLGANAYFLKGKSPSDISDLLKRGAVFLAHEHGRTNAVAGMVAVSPAITTPNMMFDFGRAATAEVNSLVIAPEYARRGLAHTLLKTAQDWSEQEGLSHLYAKVVKGANINGIEMPGNTAARAMFERQGYVQSGETERQGNPNVKLWVLTKTQ